MIKFFTDSDTDISLQVAKEIGIELISMPYIINNEIIYPYKDFEVFDSKQFYDTLRSGNLPTTCALSPEEYAQYFEPVFANGDDIVYIHFSSAMTATFDYMKETVEMLLKKYPERKFYSIDTKAITIGSYYLVRSIMDKYKQGLSIEELLEFAKEEINHCATYFFADDLKFFQKSGRVSGLSATMGNILGIKPIITINDEGVMKNISKEKGRKKALNKLVDYVLELGDEVYNHRIIIGHSDCIELAYMLGDLLKEKITTELNIEYVVVNPTAGSHCGPNTIGVAFYGKHR